MASFDSCTLKIGSSGVWARIEAQVFCTKLFLSSLLMICGGLAVNALKAGA